MLRWVKIRSKSAFKVKMQNLRRLDCLICTVQLIDETNYVVNDWLSAGGKQTGSPSFNISALIETAFEYKSSKLCL